MNPFRNHFVLVCAIITCYQYGNEDKTPENIDSYFRQANQGKHQVRGGALPVC